MTLRRNRARSKSPGISSLFLPLGAGAVGAITVALACGWRVPWLLGYLASINAVTFTFYGIDKGLGIAGLIRVPERTLHLLDLAGGTPGGLVARELFRHKTVKASFRRVFWLIAAAQTALAAWAVWYFLLR